MKILSSKQYGVNLKATVQSTGKLGFSGATANVLGLVVGGFVRFAQDDDPDNTLYLAVMDGFDEDGFKILQNGGYYSVNTKSLFKALNIDFTFQTIIYDLTRDVSKDEVLGGKAYSMSPRFLPKKNGGPGESNDVKSDAEPDECS